MKYVTTGLLALALVLARTAMPFAAQESIAGQWVLTLQTPQGTNTFDMNLALEGDKVSGQLTSPMGSVPVAGTFSGGNLVATATLDLPGMAMRLDFSALLDADALKGTAKVGMLGEFPFTGKRAAVVVEPVASVAPADASAAAQAGVDASGKWDVVLIIAGAGEFPLTATLKQDGTTVTGTLVSMAGEVPLSGTMDGASLKIDFITQTPQGPLPITLTGELAGDQFTGTATIAGMGSADWKATRGK